MRSWLKQQFPVLTNVNDVILDELLSDPEIVTMEMA